jgi:F0F1-type ATP synthase assembly protein I
MKTEGEFDKKEKAWYSEALNMFARLSIWVALPVVLASLLGRWLDSYFGTKPWLLILSIAIAFNVTIVVLIKETAKVFKKIETEEKNKK